MKKVQPAEELLEYYKSLYESEQKKVEDLESQLEESEKEIEELKFHLDRIKGSFVWRLSKPFRGALHVYERTRDRLRRYGNVRGILRKIRSKMREKKAASRIHGTKSFPGPEEVQRQRKEKFPKDVKISILVPLYRPTKIGNYVLRMAVMTLMNMWVKYAGSIKRIPGSNTKRLQKIWVSQGIPTYAWN